jgi:hypothetical protein
VGDAGNNSREHGFEFAWAGRPGTVKAGFAVREAVGAIKRQNMQMHIQV